MDFARRVFVKPSPELEAYLPNHWAARVVVTAQGECLEERVISTPFDADARDLPAALREKWRRLLPTQHALFSEPAAKLRPAALWQIIDQRVSMPRNLGSHPDKIEG